MKNKYLVIGSIIMTGVIIVLANTIISSGSKDDIQLLYKAAKGDLDITVEAEGVLEPQEVVQLTPNHMFKKDKIVSSGAEEKKVKRGEK